MKIRLLLCLMLFSASIFGQVVQFGKVSAMEDPENPLAGVALTVPSVHDCQPTMSDSNGLFRLCFKEHGQGDVICGIEVKKKGYEVVNLHVTRSWTLTTSDTLLIFMAPKSKVKEARSRYYELGEASFEEMPWLFGGECLFEVESPVFSFNISRYSKGVVPSDVDVDIPVTEVVDDRTFVVIISNEEYQQEQDVPFAIHDGEVFRDYCIQLLGIPEQHVHWVTDATLNNMRYEVDWLKAAMEACHGEARGIFYYSGHGIPDETSRSAYLLPVDGYAANMESSYALDVLYEQLGSVEAERVTYFVDACFSGAARDGNMMAESRGVAVNAKAGHLRGNAMAFSAAQGNETAFAYPEMSHGLFTYYLLKKLKETHGDLTAGELADYLNDHVANVSALSGFKPQHPSAMGTMKEWRTTKLNRE